jgi:hypothetical protein
MTRRKRPEELSREALERATSDREPDQGALLESVPEIMAEAARRRAVERRQDSVIAVVPLAWKAIPRMAAAAVVLVLVSVGLVLTGGEPSIETDENGDVSVWVLGTGDTEVSTDLLLETIVGLENGDG